MCFRNYRLRKTSLYNCLESPISEDPWTGKMGKSRKTVSISTTAPLPYLLITVKVIHLGKASLSEMQNLKLINLKLVPI